MALLEPLLQGLLKAAIKLCSLGLQLSEGMVGERSVSKPLTWLLAEFGSSFLCQMNFPTWQPTSLKHASQERGKTEYQQEGSQSFVT